MKKVLNKYRNKKTGIEITKWETEKEYSNHSFEFDQEWEQL